MPPIKLKLTMLLPITFPSDNAEFLLNAEFIPTKSSGNVVESAITIKPTTNSLSLRKADIFKRLLTTKAPLATRTRQDMIKNARFVNSAIFQKISEAYPTTELSSPPASADVEYFNNLNCQFLIFAISIAIIRGYFPQASISS